MFQRGGRLSPDGFSPSMEDLHRRKLFILRYSPPNDSNNIVKARRKTPEIV